ncbi:MAG: class I adenylate-forming enzyme family protein [Desertimonas sp.]
MIEHLRAARDEMTAPGAPFHMSDIDVRGVTVRTFDAAPPNMRVLWENTALFGDRDYIVFEDERLTYAEAHAQVRAFAHVLATEYGVGRGDRVAVSMRNYPEWVIAYWASISLGAALVGMNAWWTTPEMDYGVRDSQPKVLIVDPERLERLTPLLDDLRSAMPLAVIATRVEGDLPAGVARWSEVVAAADTPDALPPVEIDPDDDATIFYTSGTTGFPKGAQITHRGSVANIMHLVFMALATATAEGKAVAAGEIEPPSAPPADPAAPNVYMAPTPLFHVTACNCLLHPCTLTGGKIVFTYKWDAGRALELIERERVNNFSGVPTMGRELLTHPDWDRRDTSSLRGLSGGGAPVQPDLVERIGKTLKGGAPGTGYGLTETSGIVTANSSRFYLDKPASCGPVVPCMDVKLIDETGEAVPAGPDVVGELCVKGPNVIKGYLNRAEATTESIQDGWFRTGDIARIDEDGFVFIVDRAKDMVLRGGENVYCSEVEAAIYQHPDIAEAAVFGVPDERLGEEVAAAVVLVPGATLDGEGLRAFLDGSIAKHKIPATVWVRQEPLPRNANGKFLKKDLKAELLGS